MIKVKVSNRSQRKTLLLTLWNDTLTSVIHLSTRRCFIPKWRAVFIERVCYCIPSSLRVVLFVFFKLRMFSKHRTLYFHSQINHIQCYESQKLAFTGESALERYNFTFIFISCTLFSTGSFSPKAELCWTLSV